MCLAEVQRQGWRHQWNCGWEHSPKLEARMRPHWGHVTVVLGLGLLSLRARCFWFRSYSPCSSKPWMPFLQAMWCVVRVSHPRLGMAHSRQYTFRLSLNPFSGHPMFCAPLASLGKKITHPNHMVNPLQPRFHDECLNAWQVGSAQHFCDLPRRCPWSCKGIGGEPVRVFSAAFYRVSKSHSHRAGKWWHLPHALPNFCVYYDDSLSQYSCPQPAEGRTCFSQFVWPFFVHTAGGSHCAPHVLNNVQLWGNKSQWRLQQHLSLSQAYILSGWRFWWYWQAAGKFLQVWSIQGCTKDTVVWKEDITHKGFKDL